LTILEKACKNPPVKTISAMKTTFSRPFPFLRGGAVGCLLLACLASGRASDVISNDQFQNSTGSMAIDYGDWVAQSFIASAPNLDVIMVSLLLGPTNSDGTPSAPLYVFIFNSVSPAPGSSLPGSSLTGPLSPIDPTDSNPVGPGTNTYTTGGLQLDDGTEYWIVAETSLDDGSSYAWTNTTSPSVDNPSATSSNTDATSGWSLDLSNTVSTSENQGGSWDTATPGTPQQFAISAAVPEPGTWAMLGMGGAMLFGLRGRGRRKA